MESEPTFEYYWEKKVLIEFWNDDQVSLSWTISEDNLHAWD